MRIASVGHAVFAATLVAIGILGLIKPEYAAIWAGIPKAFPAREVLLYLSSLLIVATGLGLLWPRSAAPAARVLLAWLLAWTLLFKGRFVLLAPLQEGVYQSLGENAVIIAGAWVLYAWFAADWDRKFLRFASGDQGLRIARVLYGLALLAFGFSHFAYLNLTAPLVPAWLQWPVFWAYFTGCAYLAAGAAVLSGVWARLAATLAVVQMAAFLLLVWLPIILAGKMTGFNWGEVVVNCALVAGGWVVAESYRGAPWLTAGRRIAKASQS
jgi:uncharacterized membrane protein